MPFKIIRNDITKVHANAIVNTAKPQTIYVKTYQRGGYLNQSQTFHPFYQPEQIKKEELDKILEADSIADDSTIQNAFYDAPDSCLSVCTVYLPKRRTGLLRCKIIYDQAE